MYMSGHNVRTSYRWCPSVSTLLVHESLAPPRVIPFRPTPPHLRSDPRFVVVGWNAKRFKVITPTVPPQRFFKRATLRLSRPPFRSRHHSKQLIGQSALFRLLEDSTKHQPQTVDHGLDDLSSGPLQNISVRTRMRFLNTDGDVG